MPLTLEQAIGQKCLLDFEGQSPSDDILAAIAARHIGGVTLYRRQNLETPTQTRSLTDALQRAARDAGQPLLLIAADQEGGQLMAVGEGATPFPGNMALGATGSPDLAEEVGYAIGRELAAMGINVNYAPVCDINTNPQNPVIGLRSFGEDPHQVAQMCAAEIHGLAAAGIAATAKHFPGHGDTSVDSHDDVPVVPHDRGRLDRVELVPFASSIEAGVPLIMTAHVSVPALTQQGRLPATLSRIILNDLLREEMAFDGVIITDAMNMGAIEQGMAQVVDAIAAVLAGADLLLLGSDVETQEAVLSGLIQAARRGVIPHEAVHQSAARVLALKGWLSSQTVPDLDVVGCAAHQALADKVGEQSITLVRDDAELVPLQLGSGERVAVILPELKDLTPADTSSYASHTLTGAIREYHPAVDEFIVAHSPSDDEIGNLRQQALSYDLLIVGTINAGAQPGQAALMNALIETRKPVIATALRTPYDLLSYPTVPTYACTYGISDPSMRALAKALLGQIPFRGHLPVSIGRLYPSGIR